MKRELLYYLRQLHAKQIFHQTESDHSMKQLLTTAQFQDSLIRYIGTSKPDPLARAQLEKLALSWEQDDSEQMICCGTLSISSEYVCVTILVMCNCKIDTTNNTAGGAADFQNEFHFQLTASAKLLPVSTAGEEGEQPKKKLRSKEERVAKRKLHTGMLKRLQSDKLISRLLEDDKDSKQTTNKPTKGVGVVAFCEAIVQQNPNNNNTVDGELEERVNVHDETLEGIRNAVFSHTEDNLDVLELLLSMPYLPRTTTTQYENVDGQERTLLVLGDRAYLRLLEDAMFDACEKEGEDDMLDELNISSGDAADIDKQDEDNEMCHRRKRGANNGS